MTALLALSGPPARTFRIPRVRILLLLLIFTPLIYAQDGDPYRAYKIMAIGMLFLMVALPDLLDLRMWARAGVAAVPAVCLLILLQPVVLPLASAFYNLKFAAVMLFSFLPVLYLSNLNRPCSPAEMQFLTKALRLIFYTCVLSLLVTAVTGVGEIYTEGGAFQSRVFSWLGDGFAPVMVFFLYFHLFAKKPFGALVSMVCIVFLMQSKTSAGMAVFGYVAYLFIIGRGTTRLMVLTGIVIGVVVFPVLLQTLSDNLHNFDYSFNNRLLSYNAGVEFFLSSPWLGVGANQTFSILSDSAFETTQGLAESGIPFYDFFQIHNAFLRALAEMGIFGFTLLLLLCWSICKRSWKTLRKPHLHESLPQRAISSACALWLLSFVVFHQTTGWFEPGHPQLAWLVCFLGLMNFLNPPAARRSVRRESAHPSLAATR